MPSIFSACVATMIERAQGEDLLSLSKAKEKTNINHSSPLGPLQHRALGEWHKDSTNVVFSKKKQLHDGDSKRISTGPLLENAPVWLGRRCEMKVNHWLGGEFNAAKVSNTNE